MSTRASKGKLKHAGFIAQEFVARHHDLGEHHDRIMLNLRLMRNLLAAHEGHVECWVEIAGVFDLCGLHAQTKGNADWYQQLHHAVEGLKAIEARARRVGGRYAGTEAEIAQITQGLNLVDYVIMPSITAVEWNHYTRLIHQQYEAEAQRLRDKEQQACNSPSAT